MLTISKTTNFAALFISILQLNTAHANTECPSNLEQWINWKNDLFKSISDPLEYGTDPRTKVLQNCPEQYRLLLNSAEGQQFDLQISPLKTIIKLATSRLRGLERESIDSLIPNESKSRYTLPKSMMPFIPTLYKMMRDDFDRSPVKVSYSNFPQFSLPYTAPDFQSYLKDIALSLPQSQIIAYSSLTSSHDGIFLRLKERKLISSCT